MPSIVGTCRVARAAQPDATAVDPTHKYYDAKSDPEKNNRWVSVLVEFEALFETPITIKELRAQATINPIIAGMTLLRQSRLSVMPVSNDEWQAVLDLQCRKERGEDLEQTSTSSNEKSKGTERIKRASSSSISSAQKKKKKKKTKGNTVALTVDDPGYCSNPDRQLSAEQVEAVRQDTATKITEKDLGLTGRKHLYEIKADGGSTSILVHFYEGNKFIGKDKARMGAMVDAAKQRGHENGKTGDVYLLLSENSGMCKRNTFPRLLEEGVIVQRVA
jgi:EVE domain